ncbi:hypothetical protein [Nocardia rhizosphaerihabitans]|uniref:hypothetical protein n=1 Tax=Nocardia rhizosphaerihabitans TaxID=1691570 RepID=UPI001665588C|nr:hypothetical protein [Nocardia rhizosphaerihabitans]
MHLLEHPGALPVRVDFDRVMIEGSHVRAQRRSTTQFGQPLVSSAIAPLTVSAGIKISS